MESQSTQELHKYKNPSWNKTNTQGEKYNSLSESARESRKHARKREKKKEEFYKVAFAFGPITATDDRLEAGTGR